jgi:hypothetical protein
MALPESGPYLMAALLCERVMQEQDGTVSIMRAVDRLTVNASPTPMALAAHIEPPEAMPPVQVPPLTLFVAFKSGSARGRHAVNIRLEQPDTTKLPLQQQSVLFEGEDRGVNLIMQLNLLLNQEGLYWFHLSLDNEFLTRVPLRLVYSRQALSQ